MGYANREVAYMFLKLKVEFWWAVHNLVAHPLITLTFKSRLAYRFHEWTADRISEAALADYLK